MPTRYTWVYLGRGVSGIAGWRGGSRGQWDRGGWGEWGKLDGGGEDIYIYIYIMYLITKVKYNIGVEILL